MNKYDDSLMPKRNWPALYQLEDRSWQRIWKIQLVHGQTVDVDLTEIEEALSNHEISVSITKVNDELHVEVTTLRWGWDDDLIIYSYKMLKTLLERIEAIITIQNDQKDMWNVSLFNSFSASNSLKDYYEAVEQRWKEDLEWHLKHQPPDG